MSEHPLIAFLRARLDEDEMTANGAGADCWHECDDGDLAFHDRFDLEWVLREVESKRRIIGLHEITVERDRDAPPFNPMTGDRTLDIYEVTCAVCGWATTDPTSGCETLRLLALPYTDHPDYREEWKP